MFPSLVPDPVSSRRQQELPKLIMVAKQKLCHRTDGPLTPFVLISRATELVAKNHHDPVCNFRVMAEALHESLVDLGWVPDPVIEVSPIE